MDTNYGIYDERHYKQVDSVEDYFGKLQNLEEVNEHFERTGQMIDRSFESNELFDNIIATIPHDTVFSVKNFARKNGVVYDAFRDYFIRWAAHNNLYINSKKRHWKYIKQGGIRS